MQEQVDLIAERLARVVDRLQDDLREIRALLRHQQELTERQCAHLRASPFSPYGALPKEGWTLENADGWQ